jgi:DNA excision repair protein ERCC-1
MASTSNTILVSKKQTGNDLLKKLTRCPYSMVDIEPDFIVGRTTCVLYLSIRWHALHPNYIYERVNRLADNFELRVLLVNVDHVEHKSYLMELTKLSIRSNLALMLSWTIEDAAMILEKLKLNEDKPPDAIMEKPTSEEHGEALDQYVIDAISESRSITRVDAAFLVSLFGSFERLVEASPEDFALCYGVGFRKGQKLHELLHRPMKRGSNQLPINPAPPEIIEDDSEFPDVTT